jgi:hypothetical protein
MDVNSYTEGFLAGQVVAYCEQVKTGSRLAGQIDCDERYASTLANLIRGEDCFVKVEGLCEGRVSLWIYRQELVSQVIDNLQSAPKSEVGMWSMGKLLGYADCEIVRFVESSRLASAEGSSQRHESDIVRSGTA